MILLAASNLTSPSLLVSRRWLLTRLLALTLLPFQLVQLPGRNRRIILNSRKLMGYKADTYNI